MKLYWRVKKNGKWTWRPAKVRSIVRTTATTDVVYMEVEE